MLWCGLYNFESPLWKFSSWCYLSFLLLLEILKFNDLFGWLFGFWFSFLRQKEKGEKFICSIFAISVGLTNDLGIGCSFSQMNSDTIVLIFYSLRFNSSDISIVCWWVYSLLMIQMLEPSDLIICVYLLLRPHSMALRAVSGNRAKLLTLLFLNWHELVEATEPEFILE